MVESMIRYSKSGSSDTAAKIRRQTPLRLHRLKRRNTLFQSPNACGRSRQGEPVRTIHSTPSTNIRLSRPVDPFWSGRPMISGAIRSHAASLKTNRSITPKTASWIPERSATRLREADLNVLSKLGNQGLEGRLEPEAFTGGEVGREDDRSWMSWSDVRSISRWRGSHRRKRRF